MTKKTKTESYSYIKNAKALFDKLERNIHDEGAGQYFITTEDWGKLIKGIRAKDSQQLNIEELKPILEALDIKIPDDQLTSARLRQALVHKWAPDATAEDITSQEVIQFLQKHIVQLTDEVSRRIDFLVANSDAILELHDRGLITTLDDIWPKGKSEEEVGSRAKFLAENSENLSYLKDRGLITTLDDIWPKGKSEEEVGARAELLVKPSSLNVDTSIKTLGYFRHLDLITTLDDIWPKGKSEEEAGARAEFLIKNGVNMY